MHTFMDAREQLIHMSWIDGWATGGAGYVWKAICMEGLN